MKQFFAFVKKEFYHIWRDKRTMFILLGNAGYTDYDIWLCTYQ